MKYPESQTWKRIFRCLLVAFSCSLLVPELFGLGDLNSAAEAGRRRSCIPRRFRRHCACKPCSVPHVAAATYAKETGPVWRSLFDGMSLEGWKITNFGGEGEVIVENGQISLEFGSSLTGITYTKEFPKTNYELRFEAMQVDGIDFFCGTTFPVGDSHCSFIAGGWAGAVVGLSNIDDRDASENETTRYMTFRNGQWYRIRIRVTPERITAWIDAKKVIDQKITGRKISTRPETDLSKPLGIAAWETRAALKNIAVLTIPEK